MFDFRKWFRKTFRVDGRFGSQRKPRPIKRPRTRLDLEVLENRIVPTVAFNPVFFNSAGVAETATTPQNPAVIDNTPVYLVFWGNYWQSGTGVSQAADIKNSVSTLLPNNGQTNSYLLAATQYGTTGHAYYAGDLFLNTPDGNGNFTNSTFSNSQLENTLETGNPDKSGSSKSNNYAQGATNSSIYIFITPPGTTDTSDSDDNGYHSWDPIADTAWAWVGAPAGSNVPSEWSQPGPTGGLDAITPVITHELVESMTDPNDVVYPFNSYSGTIVQPAPAFVSEGAPDEIADFEAQGYFARVNGIEAQAYWSQRAGEFVVSDGNSTAASSQNPKAQVLQITNEQWSNYVVTSETLVINGDQLSNTKNDVITISKSQNYGIEVNLNGYDEWFDPNQITSIVINPGAGNNTINVETSDVPVTINDTSHDTVNVSGATAPPVSGTSAAAVTINDSGSSTINLTNQVQAIDVSATGTPTQINLNNANVDLQRTTGSTTITLTNGTNNIEVDQQDWNVNGTEEDYIQGQLTIRKTNGTGNLWVQDESGPDVPGLITQRPHYTVTNDTVSWNDTISYPIVNETFDPYGSISYSGLNLITIVGGKSSTTFTVNPVPSLLASLPAVAILGESGADTLTVDDTGAANSPLLPQLNNNLTYTITSDQFNLSDQVVSSDGSETFPAQPIGYEGIASLNIDGSSSLGVTYDVQSTSAAATTLNGGKGNDTFVIGSPTTGLDAVGGVTVAGGGGQDTLTINDALGVGPAAPVGATVTSRSLTYNLTGQQVTRTASMFYTVPGGGDGMSTLLPIIYAGISNMELNGSNDGAAYTVTGTNVPTTIVTGTGGTSQINVQTTSAPLTINSGAGSTDTIDLGSSANTLDPIQGLVTVNGDGSDVVSLDDQGSTSDHDYLVTNSTVTRGNPGALWPVVSSVPAMLDYKSLSQLVLTAGVGDSNGNIESVQSTVAGTNTILNLGAHDTTEVGNNGLLDGLQGQLTVNGQGQNYLNLNDSASLVDHIFTVASASITRDGIAPIDYSGLEGLELVGGTGRNNTFNLDGIIPSSMLTVFGGGGSSTFNVSPDAENLDNLSGILFLYGGTSSQPSSGSAALNVYDQNAPTLPTYTTTADSIVRSRMAGATEYETYIDYSGFNQVSLNGVPLTSPLYGLAAYYPADGNATDTFSGNNATLHGGVTFVPGAVGGQAFSFDGTGYVQAADSPTLEPSTVSVDVWVKSSTIQPGRYILAKGAEGNAIPSYALWTGNGGLVFYIGNNTNGATYVASPDAGTGIWDGKWHHVTGTFDGSTVRLYVDGVQVGNGTPTNLAISYGLPTSNDLYIGTYNGEAGYNFSGQVDDLGIYNRALSAADIQALQGSTSTPISFAFTPAVLPAAPQFLVDGTTLGGSTLALLPGDHTLETANGDGVSFTVNPNGTVSYPASEDGLSGAGSTTLSVWGLPVTIGFSAQAAQAVSQVVVDGTVSENTASPFTLSLLPGIHTLKTASGDVLSFTVNDDGSIRVPASEDGELSVQADGSLLVNALS